MEGMEGVHQDYIFLVISPVDLVVSVGDELTYPESSSSWNITEPEVVLWVLSKTGRRCGVALFSAKICARFMEPADITFATSLLLRRDSFTNGDFLNWSK
jgi:fumarylacetoacetate (FAA) hydrolase family protein